MKTKQTIVYGAIAVVLALAFIACEQPTDTPTLTGITAVYTQGSAVVYPTTPLDSLKAGLTVTATYSNGTTQPVTSYTLNGTLTVGTSAVTVSYTDSDSVTKTTTFTVTVTAAPVTYTVTFNANGATSGTAPAAQTASSGSSITLPGGSGLTKTGSTFGGWNTNADGTGTNYAANASYTVTANITLYAKWDVDGTTNYTVTFNANGATSGTAPAAQTASSGSSITLPGGSGLTKSGYTFGGWNATAEGTGTGYAVNSSYTVTANITLYAKWIAEGTATYTVTFNANGATSGTAPAAQTASSGSSITIPNGSGLTKTGSTFGGWNTNAEGTGTNYAANASYTVTANITLYAKWDVAGTTNYTVTFNSNGGSNVQSQTVASGGKANEPQNVTRSGYTLAGWFRDNTTFQNQWNFATDTVTANITLYAKWNVAAPTNYTVTFNSGGGSAVQAQTVASGDKATEPQNVTRNGYTLAGWFRDNTTFQNQWNFATDTVTQDITLYAKWNENAPTTVTVTFDTDGGSNVNSQTVETGEYVNRPANNPTKTGYTFVDWYTSAEYEYLFNFNIPINSSRTAYAKWNINQYTVTFDSNGGSAVTAQTVDYGSKVTEVTEPQNVTRNGDILEGWYSDNTTFQNQWNFATNTVTQDITLYAKWRVTQTDMVYVSGGTFQLGKNLGTGGGSDVTPVSNVTLTGFYIGKYEVTQAQWQAVMGSLPSSLTSNNYGKGDTYPIYYVNWYDTLVFCNKLSIMEGLTPAYRISNSTNPDDWGTPDTAWNAVEVVSSSTGYRLPTEAQWEYAAKGGDPAAEGWVGYTYSGSDTVGDVAWYTTNSGFASHAVGTKAPNGLGIYDMSGNVWEWCWDRYRGYTSEDKTDPNGDSWGSDRVLRGGDWGYTGGGLSSAERGGDGPITRGGRGFRLARPAQ